MPARIGDGQLEGQRDRGRVAVRLPLITPGESISRGKDLGGKPIYFSGKLTPVDRNGAELKIKSDAR